MSWTLLRATTKSNWVITAIFAAIMLMYLSVMISMFDPESMEKLIAMMEAMPRDLMSAMGVTGIGTDLVSFIGNFFYKLIAILFPTIYCIIVANRLVARHVDSGSMAYLLSTPNSRVSIVATQAVYLIASITTLFGFTAASGILISQAMFPGLLDIGGFLLLNLIAMLIFYAISGICFFFSCMFDDSKYALALGSAVPILFFITNMLGNITNSHAWLGRISLFALMNPDRILAGDSSFIAAGILITLAIAMAFYVSGIILFNKRSLSL